MIAFSFKSNPILVNKSESSELCIILGLAKDKHNSSTQQLLECCNLLNHSNNLKYYVVSNYLAVCYYTDKCFSIDEIYPILCKLDDGRELFLETLRLRHKDSSISFTGENNDIQSHIHKESPQPTQISEVEERSSNRDLLYVPESAVPEVLEIIARYNKDAAKWNYELLEYNAESHTISGKFTTKTDAKDSKAGMWQEMKEEFKNGYLEYDWKRILKLCGVR